MKLIKRTSRGQGRVWEDRVSIEREVSREDCAKGGVPTGRVSNCRIWIENMRGNKFVARVATLVVLKKSRSSMIEGEGEGGGGWFRSSAGTCSPPGTSRRPRKLRKHPLLIIFINIIKQLQIQDNWE
jgi:hypothetical protein